MVIVLCGALWSSNFGPCGDNGVLLEWGGGRRWEREGFCLSLLSPFVSVCVCEKHCLDLVLHPCTRSFWRVTHFCNLLHSSTIHWQEETFTLWLTPKILFLIKIRLGMVQTEVFETLFTVWDGFKRMSCYYVCLSPWLHKNWVKESGGTFLFKDVDFLKNHFVFDIFFMSVHC